MFVELFFHLRRRGLAVGVTEWLTLVEGLAAGMKNNEYGKYLMRMLTAE